jgi:hypothetical protein
MKDAPRQMTLAARPARPSMGGHDQQPAAVVFPDMADLVTEHAFQLFRSMTVSNRERETCGER